MTIKQRDRKFLGRDSTPDELQIAVEIALQAAMLHTQRSKFLSLEGSYHGNSIGTLSIGSSDNRKQLPNLLSSCHKIEPHVAEGTRYSAKVRLKPSERPDQTDDFAWRAPPKGIPDSGITSRIVCRAQPGLIHFRASASSEKRSPRNNRKQ